VLNNHFNPLVMMFSHLEKLLFMTLEKRFVTL